MRGPVVEVGDLRKKYGNVIAVDGVSLSVERGEIFGIVGPNGAGKTTTMDCITGMRRPDSGEVSVLGIDPRLDGRALLQRIGIQQQDSELPDRIKVREAMDLFSSFYRAPIDWVPVFDSLNLSAKLESHFSALSGGQKKRLFVALALVGDPDIVFLDELTSGLDPQSRRSMWELVQKLRDGGRTVFLSTHYMDEAERLCDRVAVIDNGRIVAIGTPEELIASLGRRLRMILGVDPGFDECLLCSVPGVVDVSRVDDSVLVDLVDSSAVVEVVAVLGRTGTDLSDFRTERATLEDVFLELTGREMRD